jgi:hypothetical protein
MAYRPFFLAFCLLLPTAYAKGPQVAKQSPGEAALARAEQTPAAAPKSTDGVAADPGAPPPEAAPDPNQEAPRVVLHDMMTNNVCIFESKMYSPGSRVHIDGQVHVCTNTALPRFLRKKDAPDAAIEARLEWVPVQ